jgi:hypothetical protein
MDLDANNPIENKAVVVFDSNTDDGWFRLKEWNGIDIQENMYQGKSAQHEDLITLTVPAGENSFLFDITYTRQSGDYIYNDMYDNIELQYAFVPGREYTVKGKTKSVFLLLLTVVTGYTLELYDTTEGSELLKEWVLWEKE